LRRADKNRAITKRCATRSTGFNRLSPVAGSGAVVLTALERQELEWLAVAR
jgi:hypothetical protein